jgi:hypothetical protein
MRLTKKGEGAAPSAAAAPQDARRATVTNQEPDGSSLEDRQHYQTGFANHPQGYPDLRTPVDDYRIKAVAGLVVYAPPTSNEGVNRLKFVYSGDKEDMLKQIRGMPHMLLVHSWRNGGVGMVYGKVDKGEGILDAVNREFRLN